MVLRSTELSEEPACSMKRILHSRRSRSPL